MSHTRILASLVRDKSGAPEFFVDSGGLKHYKIVIEVPAPYTLESTATLRLHESFWDPVRELFKAKDSGKFTERITSYGDFNIEVLLNDAQNRPIRLRRRLTEALKDGLVANSVEEAEQGAVLKAISDLASH